MRTREVADICQDLIQERANAQTLAKTHNGERVQSIHNFTLNIITQRKEELIMTKNLTMGMAVPHIDFWFQYNLTIEQASAYFCIGENKMRKIVEEHKNEDFILRNGTKTLIKKELFGKFLDRQNVI